MSSLCPLHLPRIIGSCLLVLALCAQALAAGPPEVAVEVVQVISLPLLLEYPGRVAGYREVEVRAQVSGILQERTYVEGRKVQQGQVLFRIDPRQYEAELTRAKGALAQARARLRETQRNLKRVRKLASKGFASDSEMDSSISLYEQSKANVEVAEAEVQARQIDLDYTTVRAPISGITSREARSEGSLVVANDPLASLLTQLTQLDPVFVNFALPADAESARLRDGVEDGSLTLPENGKVTAQVMLNSGKPYPYKGYVDFADSLIDKATGTVSARAVVPNPQQRLLPGQFVRIQVTGLTRPHAITLPERAVAQDADGTYVYVVDAAEVVHKQPVVVGHTAGGRWIVNAGLQGGERVVVEGLQRIKPDQPVRVAQVVEGGTNGLIEAIGR